nr:hypothetical protein [Microvirga arabica]
MPQEFDKALCGRLELAYFVMDGKDRVFALAVGIFDIQFLQDAVYILGIEEMTRDITPSEACPDE